MSVSGEPPTGGRPLELWAGVECTHNRVRDRYFDQLDRTGHAQRFDDLRLIAGLGVKTVRYPVLWERVEQPDGSLDWRWCDERLAALRDLGIRVIAGLVHHGSGPLHTSLMDSRFPEKLAAFAQCVASRYPWIEDFTPINEPLTTARFSALYGHWYPHRHDDSSFLCALLNETRATVLSMQAIRTVTPRATLIQTEDLGCTFSTPQLSYQAEFENERRWLPFDLLCGRVGREHPLWPYLLNVAGHLQPELEFLQQSHCPPNLAGFNYYLSSERFLDENIHRYPAELRGGNGRHRYADVETVRVRAEGVAGPERLLMQAWDRLRLPLAITECHNGCTREEQARWMHYVWNGCERARAHGADVRAMTAWSIFGAVDWDSLVTLDRGHYEPGIFDVQAPKPRPTLLANVCQALAHGEPISHPALDGSGWWERDQRFCHGFSIEHSGKLPPPKRRSQLRVARRSILVLGEAGPLPSALADECELRGLNCCVLYSRDNSASLKSAVDEIKPWALVFGSGHQSESVSCDGAGEVFRVPGQLACQNIPILMFSSDLVFDGTKEAPYFESDAVCPLNARGARFASAENDLMASCPNALVVRTGMLFGPHDPPHTLPALVAEHFGCSPHSEAWVESFFSPTYVPDLLRHSLDLLLDGETGIWHLPNRGEITGGELRSRITRGSISADRRSRSAGRPTRLQLVSERGWPMASLECALARYFEARERERDAYIAA